MGIINIYLKDSGSIANLQKDFPLYKGAYRNNKIDIYVPITLLPSTPGHIGAVKTALIITKPNGDQTTTISYNAPLKTENVEVNHVTYNVYEQDLPQKFTSEAGDQTLIINYYDMDNVGAVLTNGSILKANSVVGTNSVINGVLSGGETLDNDLVITETAKLRPPSLIYVGSTINTGSSIGDFYYVEPEVLHASRGIVNVPYISSIITSQTATLVVQNSEYIDNEEIVEPSQFELLSAEVNQKQDKIDGRIIPGGTLTTNSVVTSINELNNQVTANEQAINGTEETEGILDRLTTAEGDIDDIQEEQRTQNHDISQNATDIDTLEGKVANLEDIVGSGEDYIGTYTNTYDPNNASQLATLKPLITAYVKSVRGNDYDVQGGDVVIYIQTVEGGTDRNYKFIYSGATNDWTFFEIPATEKADNNTYGIVKGSTTGDVQVKIVGGQFTDIQVKNNSNQMSSIDSYLNNLDTRTTNQAGQISTNTDNITTQGGKISTLEGQMANVINGTTKVGYADKADKDGNGNNIVNTYLSQTAGVTKTQMKEYALPRAFNDVSYLTSEGYGDTLGDSANPIYTATSTSIGDTQIFSANKDISNYEFQLASKNSYTTTLYISASANCTVQLRLGTELNINGDWYNAVYELTDSISFTANEIKKVTFNSTLALLDQVYNIGDGDAIRQTLEVITDTSSSLTFNVYSNDTYPSTFYLNTTSQTIATLQGFLGEIPVYTTAGTVSDTTLTFTIPSGVTLNNNTNALFKLAYSGSVSSVTVVQLSYDNSNVKIIVPPYNKTTLTNATPSDLEGVYTNGVGYEFEGLIQQISGDFVVYATIGGANSGGSNITINNTVGSESISDGVKTLNVVTRDTDQTITAPKTISLSGVNDTYSKSISASGEQLTISRPDNTYQKTNSAGIVFEQLSSSSNGSSRSTSNQIVSYAGASSGYYRTYTPDTTEPSKTLSASMSVSDSKSELKCEDKTGSSTVTHSLSVDKDGVKEDGTLLSSTYQKITDNTLNTTNKTIVGAINELDSGVSGIDDLIPAQASSSNQLADKEFVNSSISTNTANFIGTFANVPTLNAYSGTVTNNDYAFVVNSVITDNGNDWANTTDLNAYNKALLTNFDYAWVVNGSNFDLYRFDIVNQNWVLRVTNTAKASVTLNTAYNRYKATVSGSTVTWAYEYTLNNSSFTASQWAAINSGATASNIGQIATNTSNIGNLSSNKADKTATVSNVSYDSTNKKIQQTINGTTTDVVTLGDNAFTNTHIPVYTEETVTIATNSWDTLVSGSDVYKVTAVALVTHTLGNDTEVSIANNNAILFAKYGFVIGSIDGQNIDVYATQTPTESVTLTFSFKD